MSKEDSKVAGRRRSASQDGREEILGILDNDTIVSRLMNLALVFDDQGHPKVAEQVYEEVIQKRRDPPRQEDQVFLFCQSKISSIQRQFGLYTKAEDQCMRVLEHGRPTPRLSLQTAGNLALVWRDQGKFDIAFDRILDLLGKETCSPYQDATHLRLVTILAIIFRDYGHYRKSFFLMRNALRVSDELYGREDPFTLDLASELSQVLNEQRSHGLAEEFARRAFDGFADQFGTDHPQSLKALSRLANAMLFNERLWDATELFERTLKAQELQLGSTHPDTVPTKCGLAATYALGARYRDSVSILRQTLIQQEVLHGQDSHPDTDWTLQALDKIDAFQKTLGTFKNETQEKSMRDFFLTPFRKDYIKLQLCDDIAVSQEDTDEVRSHSNEQPLADAPYVCTDLKSVIPSSLEKASVRGIYGTTLHKACLKGDFKSVQKLLAIGEDCNAEGGIFETPLGAASYGRHINIVSSLLQYGAKVRDRKHGFAALQLAVSMNHMDTADKLVNAGANLEDTDHWYGNILHEASMNGEERMVKILLDANAKLNAATGIFGTALGAAAWKGNHTIVQSLIAEGAIVDIQVEGRTALDFAISRGHWEIMETLKKAAKNSNDPLESKERSKPKKHVDTNKMLMEDFKPVGQPLKPTKPQTQRLTRHSFPIPRTKFSVPYKKNGKVQAAKSPAGKKKGRFMSLAEGFTSATKRRIPSLSPDPRSKLVIRPARA